MGSFLLVDNEAHLSPQSQPRLRGPQHRGRASGEHQIESVESFATRNFLVEKIIQSKRYNENNSIKMPHVDRMD